jgi:F420-dependent oxidoreductase-like protein
MTGLGKPLKSILHPLSERIPIYIAAEGPKNIALAAEIGDGWLPLYYSPYYDAELYRPCLQEGFARRGGQPDEFEIAPSIPFIIHDDVEQAADLLRPMYALYFGGMGARQMNFHHQVVVRMGYGAEAKKIQDLYLDGKKDQAAARVPGEWLELSHLVGPVGYIKDRVGAYKEAGVTVLSVNPVGPDAVKQIETLRAIVDDA